MRTVTLTKPWGKHLPGTTLEVDPQRAAQLEHDGFLAQPKAAAASAAQPKTTKAKGS